MLAEAPLMVVSKNSFNVMTHFEAKWPSQQTNLIFICYFFPIS